MRHTRAHTGNRRSHHALKASIAVSCEKCKSPKLKHVACRVCGTYKGKEAIAVSSKIEKKAKKKTKKE